MNPLAINPAKVLLIVNSDVPLSKQAADYYTEARGLNPGNRLTFALGTAVKWYPSQSTLRAMIDTVGTFITERDIELVVCSAGVPEWLSAPGLTSDGGRVLANILGASPSCVGKYDGALEYAITIGDAVPPAPYEAWQAAWWLNRRASVWRVTNLAGDTDYAIEPNVTSAGGFVINWFDMQRELHDTGGTVTKQAHPLNSTHRHFIPFGRLGNPRVGTGGTLLQETFAEVKRIIDDALAEEGRTADRLGLFGPYNRAQQMQSYNVAVAMRMWQRAGAIAKHFWIPSHWSTDPVTLYAHMADYKPANEIPKAGYADSRARFMAGDASLVTGGHTANVFALIGTGILNPWSAGVPGSHPYVNSFTVARGGFAYESTSFGQMVGHDFLNKGGCAYVGSMLEPYAGNIISFEGWMSGLTLGMPMAVAMMYGMPGKMVDCVGDPLYAPFKHRAEQVRFHWM